MSKGINEGNRVYIEFYNDLIEGIVHEKREIKDIDGATSRIIYKVYLVQRPSYFENVNTVWVDETWIVRKYNDN